MKIQQNNQTVYESLTPYIAIWIIDNEGRVLVDDTTLETVVYVSMLVDKIASLSRSVVGAKLASNLRTENRYLGLIVKRMSVDKERISNTYMLFMMVERILNNLNTLKPSLELYVLFHYLNIDRPKLTPNTSFVDTSHYSDDLAFTSDNLKHLTCLNHDEFVDIIECMVELEPDRYEHVSFRDESSRIEFELSDLHPLRNAYAKVTNDQDKESDFNTILETVRCELHIPVRKHMLVCKNRRDVKEVKLLLENDTTYLEISDLASIYDLNTLDLAIFIPKITNNEIVVSEFGYIVLDVRTILLVVNQFLRLPIVELSMVRLVTTRLVKLLKNNMSNDELDANEDILNIITHNMAKAKVMVNSLSGMSKPKSNLTLVSLSNIIKNYEGS